MAADNSMSFDTFEILYPELVFVNDTSATTCYGCKGRVREKPSAPPPPSPYDLFIRHSEIRVYNRPGDTKLRLSLKPEMVYFHPLNSCVNLTVQDVSEGKLIVVDGIKQYLNEANKRLLLKEFGILGTFFNKTPFFSTCFIVVV